MIGLYNRSKENKNEIKRIISEKKNCLIIHYSCESFYDIEEGKTPRITTIAIKHLDTGNDTVFSIHKIAELNKISIAGIEKEYDKIEKQMLEEFYKFVSEHSKYEWLHWNMKNINYGFSAIEHRFRVLGGEPICINDRNKINLADKLYLIYGKDYIKDPKFYSLVAKNKFTHKDILSGEEEAIAFENKEYIKLYQSTLRKVEVIYKIIDYTYSNSLKIDLNFVRKHFNFWLAISYCINEHPIVSSLITLSGWIIAIITFISK